jgi:8-oxo-dGTP diphosphatase
MIGQPINIKQYVVGFLFCERPRNLIEVCLIEKQKPQWQQGFYNGVGGKIEHEDFNAHDAMAREFREETGVHIPISQWRHFCNTRGFDWMVYFFTAWVQEPEQYLIKQIEAEKPEWFPIVQIQQHNLKVIPNLHWLIPLALDKDRVVASVEDYSPPGVA